MQLNLSAFSWLAGVSRSFYDMHYTYSFDKKALKQLDEPVQTYIID